jgi:hypothetical protein
MAQVGKLGCSRVSQEVFALQQAVFAARFPSQRNLLSHEAGRSHWNETREAQDGAAYG